MFIGIAINILGRIGRSGGAVGGVTPIVYAEITWDDGDAMAWDDGSLIAFDG